MAKKRYDVIIVGAGVSGFMLARFLRDSTLRVLLLEKRPTVKKLANSRFGLNRDPIDKYNLSEAVIVEYDRFAFGGKDPKDWFYYVHKNKPFVVIDFDILAKKTKLTCDVKTKCSVKKAHRTKDGILLFDQKKNSYLGKIVVDCSGSGKVVSTALGIKDERRSYDYLNLSYELENCKFPKDIAKTPSFPLVSFKYQNLPLWVYPYSRTNGQFGKAEFFSKKFPVVKDHEKYLTHIMKNVEPYKTWFKHAKITRRFEGVSRQTINRCFVDDNFLSCGCAAGAVPPILGEGSRIGIEMAFSAFSTIIEAFTLNDFSKKVLKKHETNLYNLVGKYYPMNELIGFIWLRYLTDREFKILVKGLAKFTPEEYIRFYRSEISWTMFFKIFSLKLVVFTTINMFRYHVLNCNNILTKRELS